MNSNVLERVKEIVADIFNVPKDRVTLQTSPNTIDTWDSIKHLDLVLALEQEFALQITPDEMVEMKSVEVIEKLITEKL
ncbi:MAG: acyl carrier protein [Ktedonobacteraceae bacterium]